MIKKIKDNFLLLIVFFTICGLIAGILGTLLTRLYFLEDSSSYFSQELNLNQLNNTRSSLIIRDPKKVVVNQDVKVEETLGSIERSLVSVFKEIPEEADGYYPLEDPLFVGLIITDDGWVIASLPKNIRDNFNAKLYTVITSDRKTYQVDKINILKDYAGDVVFFHLEGATNLPVRKIVPRSELSLGQSLLVVDSKKNTWPTNLSSLKRSADVLSSDSLNAFLELANNLEKDQENSFVFNLAGDLVAVIGSDKEIVPAFTYINYWQDFAKPEASSRPFLGVNYLNLSAVKISGLDSTKGALIYKKSGQAALVKNSPAALAGLQEGDIITWVNNQEVNQENDLGDLLARYKAGDVVTISYLRDNLEKQIDITLGELE